jgi:hypothetical protein
VLRSKPQPEPDARDGLSVQVVVDAEHEWRMRMLVQAGFGEFQAFRLSVNGVDWHDAVRMLDAGADTDQVLDILL